MSTKTTPSQIVSDKPSEKFRKAMRQILSVPKSELLRREAESKRDRANGKTKEKY